MQKPTRWGKRRRNYTCGGAGEADIVRCLPDFVGGVELGGVQVLSVRKVPSLGAKSLYLETP